MKVSRFAPGLLFALTMNVAAPARADCQYDRVARFPLAAEQRPTIPVTLNGAQVLFVVDTGAEVSSVTPETVISLNLPRDPGRRTTLETVEGKAIYPNVLLGQLAIADLKYSDRGVVVQSLERFVVGGRPAAGVLGADILSDFDMEIDAPAHTLTLYHVYGCQFAKPPWEGDYETIRSLTTNHGRLLFPIDLNGHSLTALFDTGAERVTLAHKAANDIGVTDTELDKDTQSRATSGGKTSVLTWRHTFKTFKIGDEVFPDVPLYVGDFPLKDADLVVGFSYMRKRRFFLSYSTNGLFVQSEDGVADGPMLAGDAPASDRCQPPLDIAPTLAPAPAVIVSRPELAALARLLDDKVGGCAAAVYHLAADGRAQDIKLVGESPAGEGLGDFVAAQIAATRFRANPAESRWYYEMRQFGPDEARRSGAGAKDIKPRTSRTSRTGPSRTGAS